MTYNLEFEEHALKEFKKLAPVIREQFKKKLASVLDNPQLPANRLFGLPDCYKIKLKSSGYRLVYRVINQEIVVLVLSIGKRERSEAYTTAKKRL
ncbi:type II toxin-antitoxin system RelE family toxin [Serratia entomophila]|uniref:type II toxin-antitoxin system RelE family toxin n=1 Tax=Serratia entomophila TaxID=42906 RepID=UPI00217C035C|nr:type II toxin-antitoxin system RelE/ParE family toxin [Serratia entomophila]CAI0964701.1 mRNA interferase RelE [Serratia entomophila]CAI1658743.1 mRNA interferase RelE [Serratia entomophila]CAI1687636.1 mRNA interferase RelE [Serratia entomophila]CAI1696382.1 mRNA interferase RelE [Serratia entomophila]CAI1780216.1 mRNA interferase RelE [Serratia entomophila]